ncbi:hypothetical protein PUN28_001361 [Cardiocondyla obscurior]|uniref:Secreted protein n=1 Tax=Cardiocondyla obscurior TaxID=286306 RepID=A0AAW2H4N6_9HYME
MIGGRWLLLSLLEMYGCVEIAPACTNGFALERGISILLAAADRAKLVIGAHLFRVRFYLSSSRLVIEYNARARSPDEFTWRAISVFPRCPTRARTSRFRRTRRRAVRTIRGTSRTVETTTTTTASKRGSRVIAEGACVSRRSALAMILRKCSGLERGCALEALLQFTGWRTTLLADLFSGCATPSCRVSLDGGGTVAPHSRHAYSRPASDRRG